MPNGEGYFIKGKGKWDRKRKEREGLKEKWEGYCKTCAEKAESR
jgi:hypothetical protein